MAAKALPKYVETFLKKLPRLADQTSEGQKEDLLARMREALGYLEDETCELCGISEINIKHCYTVDYRHPYQQEDEGEVQGALICSLKCAKDRGIKVTVVSEPEVKL